MDNTSPGEPDPPVPEVTADATPDETDSVKIPSSGASRRWVPPTPEEVATLFPNYEVLSILGRGGMGAVYKARQITLDRLVALKLLPLEVSENESFANRFRREARALAKLNHPHIISIHDFGETCEGHLYFAMEFVEGANLSDVIRQIGLTPEQALSLAGQICSALAYAHGKGVIHRDIKPANVMVDTDSHAKVADFGLARLTDRNVETMGNTMTGTVMGTLGYMAPEQMLDMNVDHRADIYSLGVMLYEMLCGETPQGAFSLPSERIGCDARIDQIVIRALQQSPDRRYQSTAEMEAEVESARLPPPPSAFVPAQVLVRSHHMAAPVVKPKKQHGGIIAAALVSVAAIGIFLVKAKSSGARSPATSPVASASAESMPIIPDLSKGEVSAEETPPPQLSVEDSVKRLMGTVGWETIGIVAVPDGTISVHIEDRNISDLSPLAGLPVSELSAHGNPITDLAPLRGQPLRALYLNHTPVSDISPLKDLPLLRLNLSNTRVTDLSALREMKLRTLCLFGNAPDIDLTPLAEIATLEDLVLPEKPQNIEQLRALPNLRYISYLWDGVLSKGSTNPAAEFWKSHDEQMSAGTTPPVAATPPDGPTQPQSVTGKWLAELEAQWQAEFASQVREPFEASARDLKEKYLGALANQLASSIQGQRLDDVTALRAEIARLSTGGDVPVEDDANTIPPLRALRAIYRKALAPHYTERMARAKSFHARRDSILSKNQVLLIQRQRHDEAAEVKIKSERLADEWLKSPIAIPGNTVDAAGKDQPFLNSLGMKFVPVRMSGGASGGQRVLFSVWETRVQDYEVFAKETKRPWPSPGFPQDPGHPAVNVGMADARAFATWLNERERKAGWLRSNDSYRLPKDYEWSCAAGIGEQEIESTPPKDKDLTIPNVFSWGSRWPPGAGTGNFSGEEAAGHEVWQGQQVLAGYRDDFPATSPVGTYPPNPSGLFDVGGNVWEFCEGMDGTLRRGGSFSTGTERDLNLTRRLTNDPDFLDNTAGFRLVLVSTPADK